ncbi:glycosyltransferase [Kineococcus gynurae]|uniref:Glycosyltransferase n=1 Tax=Kineococcus gynurae TaxID=452979 RepID=A0ABV5LR68_9ACTN
MSTLSVCLIVRDEERHLTDCLASLDGLADQVVVVDTGSLDATREIARRAGAVLGEHPWAGDFAAARNTALDLATGEWVLSLDADERLLGDPSGLRAALDASGPASWSVEFDDHDARSGPYRFRAPRLFRRAGTRWVGRVHERPVAAGVDLTTWPLDPAVLTIRHLGYRDLDVVQGKAVRNLQIARSAVAAALDTADADLPVLLLDLGRSALSAGELQTAVDALEALRDLVPDGSLRRRGTDFLVRVLIVAGEYPVALHLVEELDRGDAWVRWLRGQALGLSGRADEALEELDGMNGAGELRDLSGCRYDPAPLTAFRDLCRRLSAAV